MFERLSIALLFAVLVAAPSQGFAAEPNWPAGRYSYIVIDQDLKDVLTEFRRNTGLPIKLTEAVGGKRVRGEIKAADAEQYFKELCAMYGLHWYFDGTVLYVSSENERRTELIDLGLTGEKGAVAKKLMERLETMGAADQRYPIKADGNFLSVSGPPAYVSMVKETLASVVRIKAPHPATETPGRDDVKVQVFRGSS